MKYRCVGTFPHGEAVCYGCIDKALLVTKLKEENKILRECVEAALRIKDLWGPDPSLEYNGIYRGEARALASMERQFTEAMRRIDNE